MAKLAIEDTTLTNIANAIRNKKGTLETIKVSNFATEIESITGGSSIYRPRHVSYANAPLSSLVEELSVLDTQDMTCFQGTFSGCSNLVELDLSHFDTSKATTMKEMFNFCSSLKTLDISSFDTTNVTDMGFMFYTCAFIPSLDLRHFNTAKVKDMQYMFANCSRLRSIDFSSFITSEVTNMYCMFSYNGAYSLDLSNFDTSKVTNMGRMFNNASSLQTLDISGFSSASLTDTTAMFTNCTALTKLIINNPILFELKSSDALNGSAIAQGTGFVYVPDNMVDTYKNATNWSTYANQIKGISELPT